MVKEQEDGWLKRKLAWKISSNQLSSISREASDWTNEEARQGESLVKGRIRPNARYHLDDTFMNNTRPL